MKLSGGIFNRNNFDSQQKVDELITHAFNCFELEQIKKYNKNNLCLYAANNTENKISPNGIFEDHTKSLIICGEIRLYNSDELIKLLDDETSLNAENHLQLVLALYKKYSYDVVKHLNGDFSFVIWNDLEKELFCARDQMGQRPFYYHTDNKYFIFSTHLNGVAMHREVSKEEDETWVMDFFQKNISFTDKTIYKEIQRLPPAHYLIVTSQKNELIRYWRLEDVKPNSAKTIQEAILGLKIHIERSVKVRMQGTTKIGSELSGGLDSSAVASIAQYFSKQKNRSINAYSNALAEDQKFAFENFVDEWDKAAQMADFSGIKDHFAITSPVKPILELINFELNTIGSPTNFSFSGLQLGVFLKSKEQGDEVLFSGFGGDELVTEAAVGRYPFTLLKEKHYYKLFQFFQQQKGIIKGSIYSLLFLKNFIQNKELKFKQKLGMERWENILLKDEIIHQFKLKQHYIDSHYFPANQTLKERSLFRIYLPGTTERLETGYAITNALGLNYTYPLLDVKLLEYYFSLPDKWKAHPKQSRYLFRSAMKDYFPADILMQVKPTNTATIPFIKSMQKNQMQDLEETVLKLQTEVYKYLDNKKIEHLIKKNKAVNNFFKFNLLKNILNYNLFKKNN